MNRTVWEYHRDVFCSECRHRRKCPAPKILDAHPDDYACGHWFRKGRCTQFEPKKGHG